MRRLLPSFSQGFSMVELMVTLSVLAFLMLASLPSMMSWSRNSQIRTAAEALLNGLQKTRNEALRRNTNVRFSLVTTHSTDKAKLDNTCALSSSSPSWVISRQDPAGACGADLSDTTAPMLIEKWAQGDNGKTLTVTVRDANADGTCSTTATTPSAIEFNSFGRLASTSRARCINIDNSSGSGNRVLRIMVGSGGTARMCDPALTDTTDPRRC